MTNQKLGIYVNRTLSLVFTRVLIFSMSLFNNKVEKKIESNKIKTIYVNE